MKNTTTSPTTQPIALHLHWLSVKFSLLELAFAGAVATWEVSPEQAAPFLSLFEEMSGALHDLHEDVRAITAGAGVVP
jgi:hypothetical protein